MGNEFPAYAGGTGAPIDQSAADYQALGDTFNLGSTGQAADAGTTWAHGNNLTPDGHDSRDYLAKDFGFLAWTGDLWILSAGQILTGNGVTHVVKLKVPRALPTVTNIVAIVQTAGATLTASNCWAALYDNSKNKIGVTADQSGVWNSTGIKTMALTSGPFALPAGVCYVVFAATGTTLPKFLGGGLGGTLVNLGLSAANSRFATEATAVTTLGTWPATLSTFSQTNGQAYFAAIS